MTQPQKMQGFRTILATTTLLLNVILFLSSPVHADIDTAHPAVVSEFASFNTPGAIDGRVEAIVTDGDTVYVGGTFTQIQDPFSDEIINQPYLFAYSKSSGNIIRTFDPQVNNSVLALASTGEPSGGVFAGGVFGSLNGEASRGRFAKIDINGDRAGGFGARPNGSVNTMVRLGSTLYIGGTFDSISGTQIENLAALDTTTGALDPSLDLDFDGTLSTDRTQGTQNVQNIDITSDGRLLAVNGNFLTIDQFSRPRLALLELDGQARVSNWNTNIFDGDCPSGTFPNYILGIDISPDDSYLLTSSSGFRRRGEPNCDTAVRFELDDLNNNDVQPTWVNYTGGDSVYDILATDHAVYIGGHFEFLNNDTGTGNSGGAGSQARRGFAALDPKNGLTLLDWRSDRSPRGLGTFALVSDADGIYIGDDTDFLNGTEHRRFKVLPVSNQIIQRPDSPALPATLLVNDLPDAALLSRSFDGTNIGSPVEIQDSTFGSAATGAILLNDQLFHFRVSDRVLVSTLTDGAFESFDEVDLFGLTEDDWAISQIGGIFFDHDLGRVYYTQQGDSQLRWRAFTPDSPYFGNDEYIAEQQADIAWADVTGMDVIGGQLYFTRTDNTLYRAQVDGFEPVAGTTQAISGPAVDGQTWEGSFLAFGNLNTAPGNSGDAEFEFGNSGSTTLRTFRTFEFPVEPGQPVNVRLSWLDANAELDLRVRDANGELVASDVSRAGSPKWLTVPAGSGGLYTATVQIREGSTAYTLQINPVEQPPAPRADFDFRSGGTPDLGRFQRFDFDVNAGELVEARVLWDDADADVRFFLRDETNALIESETDGTGSAMLSAIAQTSGVWSVAVQINDGDVRYDVLIDTSTDFVVPEPLADFEFGSSGSATDGRFQSFNFDVNAGELIEARISWDDPAGDVRFFLRDETNTLIERETDGTGSAMLSTIAQTSGQWSVAVLVNSSNEVNYEVLVDTTTDFVVPEPLADFVFNSSGSATDGRFQSFKFDVNAGELIEARISWDDPAGDVRFFLRDETNTLIERETDGTGSAMLSAIAQTSGQWSVAVLVNSSNEVNYEVLVDTITDFVAPEPLAEFEFSSSGSATDGRFQSFNFDVIAGESVVALVTWDDPAADVRVFLRDETRSQVDRITDGTGSATVSAIAATTGRWSVAVQINSGSVSYDVLVNPVAQDL